MRNSLDRSQPASVLFDGVQGVSTPTEGGDGLEAPMLLAYCLRSSSHLARRSWRSWFGRLLLRGGAGVLGVHGTLAFLQLEHGIFLSHFILRCWHSTQARMRVGFCGGTAGDGAEEAIILLVYVGCWTLGHSQEQVVKERVIGPLTKPEVQ